jgi:hypothetical protein
MKVLKNSNVSRMILLIFMHMQLLIIFFIDIDSTLSNIFYTSIQWTRNCRYDLSGPKTIVILSDCI